MVFPDSCLFVLGRIGNGESGATRIEMVAIFGKIYSENPVIVIK